MNFIGVRLGFTNRNFKVLITSNIAKNSHGRYRCLFLKENLRTITTGSQKDETSLLPLTLSPDFKTVEDVYNKCLHVFERHQLPEPELSARYLISKAIGIPYRHSIFLKSLPKTLDDEIFEDIKSLVSRRLTREPVQYIIGDWDFLGLNLICKAPVLIPRQETEDLADRIAKRLDKFTTTTSNTSTPTTTTNVVSNNKNGNSNSLRVLDIGAGTGALGLGILKHVRSSTCVAIDVNDIAVDISIENAKRNNLASRYSCLLRSFSDFYKDREHFNTFDIIVSNPPYIPSSEISQLSDEVSKFEDVRALDGGPRGLDIINDIILNCYPLFAENGTKELWLEVSDEHPEYLQQKFNGFTLDGSNVSMEVSKFDDLYGLPRFVVIKFVVN